MTTATSPHFVILDRSDPHGPRWKLLTTLAERPATLNAVGQVDADEWGHTIHWTTVTLNRVILPRPAPTTLLWRVDFPDSD